MANRARIKCLAGLRARLGLSGRTPRARCAAIVSFSIALLCTAPAFAQCDCCEGNCGPGCDDPACEKLICAQDAFCCDVWWDNLCAAASVKQCEICAVDPSCDKGCPGDLAPPDGGDDVVNAADLAVLLASWGGCNGCCADIFPAGEPDGNVGADDLAVLLGGWGSCMNCPPNDNDCCANHTTPGCNDPACCEEVCAIDPFCCDSRWDSICAAEAAKFCDICDPPSIHAKQRISARCVEPAGATHGDRCRIMARFVRCHLPWSPRCTRALEPACLQPASARPSSFK